MPTCRVKTPCQFTVSETFFNRHARFPRNTNVRRDLPRFRTLSVTVSETVSKRVNRRVSVRVKICQSVSLRHGVKSPLAGRVSRMPRLACPLVIHLPNDQCTPLTRGAATVWCAQSVRRRVKAKSEIHKILRGIPPVKEYFQEHNFAPSLVPPTTGQTTSQ